MRLAVCALSAVLLSGCSWLGAGGNNAAYGTSNGAYGTNCATGQSGSYGQQGMYGAQGAYGQQGAYGAASGCAGGSYGVASGAQGAGYGAGPVGYGAQNAGYGAGYGDQGMGYGTQGASYAGAQGMGYGAQGAGYAGTQGYGPVGAGYGSDAYGTGANGAGTYGYGGQAIGSGLAAQGIGGGYGSDVYGSSYGTAGYGAVDYGQAAYGQNVAGTQMTNGQYVQGAQVQDVLGAPIYVAQPYAQPYIQPYAQSFGTPQLRSGGGSLPFGFELFGGTEYALDGVLKPGKDGGPSDGGGGEAGAFDSIEYADAFKEGYTVGGAATYDLSRNTTLLASAGYSKQEGNVVSTGSFQSGTYVTPTGVSSTTADVFVPDAGSTARDLQGTFGDLEQYTIEGGIRRYVGKNLGFRPYVGATAGVGYNKAVNLTQVHSDDGTLFNEQEFIASGWSPTAAGLVGAEMAVGSRAAVGVETGVRWRDKLNANADSEARLSIPVKLRGRLSF